MRVSFRGTPMPIIVRTLEALLTYEVRAQSFNQALKMPMRAILVDESGLTGHFDGDVEYTIPISSTSAVDQALKTESLQDALDRQLGLALQVRKGTGRVLVLRSADRTPTDN